ncbi:MAG: nucleotidyl transferase AbiEii/AbiGii toxin family protein [Candidatus Ratteibacteria bacterium]|jgi:hypothetical protein
MNKIELSFTGIHEDSDFFREAVNFTAAITPFLPRLIEKDCFNTLLLKYLSINNELVFKGGTCLAKVYSEFYRLSEDLNFTISIPIDSSRSEHRKQALPLKQSINALPSQIPMFKLIQQLTGANKH